MMKANVGRICIAVAFSVAVPLLSGCRTSTPYVGDISTSMSVPRTHEKPLPIQLIVDAPEKPGRTVSRRSLSQAFALGLKETGKFAEVSLLGREPDRGLTCLYADVDMDMMMYCRTPAWYFASWVMIWPMFVPWNEIAADGNASVTIRNEGQTLKTYTAQSDRQLTGRRNSVGLAYVRTQMSTWAPWASPAATNLLGELIRSIVTDTATLKRAIQD